MRLLTPQLKSPAPLLARSLVVAACACALAGCVAQGGNVRTSEQRLKNDAVYMAQVEHVARKRGVTVQWVNPPRDRSGGM